MYLRSEFFSHSRTLVHQNLVTKLEFEYIHTNRIILRKLDTEVYRFVFNNYSPQELQIFFGHESEREIEDQRLRFEKGMENFNKKMLIFHLISKEKKEVFGWCGFHTWYFPHKRAELGYTIHREEYKEKGLMTEAVDAVMEYGFNQMDLHRIEALTGPDNIPSQKILENIGFKKEGLLKEHYWKDGRFDDSIVYGILKREYENRTE